MLVSVVNGSFIAGDEDKTAAGFSNRPASIQSHLTCCGNHTSDADCITFTGTLSLPLSVNVRLGDVGSTSRCQDICYVLLNLLCFVRGYYN